MQLSAVAGIKLPRGSYDSARVCGHFPGVEMRDRRV
jgi:hypothetical protein